MTRSLSRNIYKSGWVVVSGEEKCVIDSNPRLARRIEEWEETRKARQRDTSAHSGELSEEGEPEFVSGIGGEEIDALLTDNDNIIKASSEQEMPDLEAVHAEAQQIIDDAQAEAEQIRMAAQAQMDSLRKSTMAEADKKGYDNGYQRGQAEFDEMKQALADEKAQMEAEYEKLLDEIEPRFIDTITAVYSHIFGVDLINNRDILVHLIDSTLRRVESSRTFIVHVSAEDYPHVNMQKQALLEGAVGGKGMIEIIEDIALGKGDCMIETDGGIFDCGIGTQLEELTNKLRVLSFDGSKY